MKQKILMLAVTGLLMIFSHLCASADDDFGNNRALANLATAKVYFDVNVGIPAKLVSRLTIIDQTYDQLVKAGVKPDFVIGFRSKASNFVTKGEDYIFEEEKADKDKVHGWVKRFKERGIVMEQCLIAAGFEDIDPEDFLQEIEVVRNGYISMIGYQAKGYSQIPMD